MTKHTKSHCEYLRNLTRQRFDKVRSTWIDCGTWAAPYRNKWMLSQTEGQRNNHHVVDTTHVTALRSFVAGFLEGNTSATRPWYKLGTSDPEKNLKPDNHAWLDHFTRATYSVLARSNFYYAAGEFYNDYGVYNTGAHYIEELEDGNLFWHTLTPGSYYVLNDNLGTAVALVREYSMTVKALIDGFARKTEGSWDWSNISHHARKMYEDGNYTQLLDVVQVTELNDDYNISDEIGGDNRKWISKTYELGTSNAIGYQSGTEHYDTGSVLPHEGEKFLKVAYSQRKPFVVGKNVSSMNFEYGEKGPTLDALGCIKSLNKKAISKDQAIEQMIKPTLQGPANLRKSYITNAPNSYIPLDAMSASQKGLRPVYEVNPAIGALAGDVQDIRQQVNKLYYADYLLYLSSNPKTRTATETDAIVREQQIVIGPSLQSLNWSYNMPIIDFVMEYVLDNDPNLPPVPDDLAGEFLRPEFISVFAQAQRAADLPQIDRYLAFVGNVGQIDASIFDKVNLDRIADIYEDRLYLPAGVNNPQEQVDAKREQAAMQQQKQQEMEAMTQAAGAAKDVGLQVKQ